MIIEGIDSTGKSTLAKLIAQRTSWPVQESEGPAKSFEEIHERIQRYMAMPPKTIFVRHPVVSQTLYASLQKDRIILLQPIIDAFYRTHPFFIYCDPGVRPMPHRPKLDEDPEFIKRIEANYDDLLRRYREWGCLHAHVIYRIGDPMGMEHVNHLYPTM